MIDFLAANWLWIAAIALMLAMHRGGHGCGMHGRHDRHADGADRADEDRPAEPAGTDHAHPTRSRRSTS